MKDKKNKYYDFKALADTDWEITLYGDVSSHEDDINALGFKEELDKIPDGANITAYINSPGGSVFEGVAISNRIKAKKGKKKCVIDGLAASISTLIACSFDEVEIYSNALYMIHQAWYGVRGNATDLRKHADELEKMDNIIVETYKAKTGLDEAIIRDYMAKETWFSAKEALELGFVDRIIDRESDAKMCVDIDILNTYKNVPENLLEAENKIDRDRELELLALELELM